MNDISNNWLLIFLLIIGSIVMRSAGCIINDIVDINLDVIKKNDSSGALNNYDVDISNLKKADGLVVGSAICKEISKSIDKRQNVVTNVTNIVKRLKNKIQ